MARQQEKWWYRLREWDTWYLCSLSKIELSSIAHQCLKTAAKDLNDIAPWISGVKCLLAEHLDSLTNLLASRLDDLLYSRVWICGGDRDVEKSSSSVVEWLSLSSLWCYSLWILEFEDLKSDAVAAGHPRAVDLLH